MAVTLSTTVLTTLEAVRRMLGIPTAITTDDDYLKEIINAASVDIEESCGRQFIRRWYGGSTQDPDTAVPAEGYIYFSGKGQKTKALRHFPIVQTGFVLEVGGGDEWDALTINSDFVLDTENGLIIMKGGSRFTEGDRNYRVTCQAGYKVQGAAPWIPVDLEHACKVMVREAYKESERLTSEKIGDISRSYDVTKHRPLVENTLMRYRSDASLM